MRKVVLESKASITKQDLETLLDMLEPIKPKVILEIGMHQGYSMEVWRKAFNPDILIGVEINPPTPNSYTKENGMLWKTNSHSLSCFEEVVGRLRGMPVDFLFIDGDHSLLGVFKDWEMYVPIVRKGGIIALHDTMYHADGTEEVDIFWRDIRDHYITGEIKSDDTSTGIGVIYNESIR